MFLKIKPVVKKIGGLQSRGEYPYVVREVRTN